MDTSTHKLNKIALTDTVEHTTHELQELLIRMERNNNIVQRLFKKLNSYTCEPKNHVCFEKLYDLKRSFRRFMDHQERITAGVRQRTVEAKKMVSDIKLHITRFKELEKEIASYLLSMDYYS